MFQNSEIFIFYKSNTVQLLMVYIANTPVVKHSNSATNPIHSYTEWNKNYR